MYLKKSTMGVQWSSERMSNDCDCDQYDQLSLDALSNDSGNAADITLEMITNIEKKLDVDEKVSLIYLLDENPMIALQETEAAAKQNGQKVISNYVRQQNGIIWKSKLLEALAIIQDYRILNILGFSKKLVHDIYLPHCQTTSLFVHPVRKALFCIFDNLTKPEITLFLTLVKKDFLKKNIHFKPYHEDFLEMYFLHFEICKYITLVDLSNIIKIFKQMEMYNICDSLEQVMHMIKKSSEQFNKHKLHEDSTRKTSLHNESEIMLPINNSKNDCYYIDKDNPGILLIINQEYFYRDICRENQHLLPNSEVLLERRLGTNVDKERLVETFKNFNFGTNIVVKDNLTHIQILKEIKNAASTVRMHSSLFVCILSHGDEGVVYGCNSCKVNVSQIEKVMMSVNTENLMNKPKVLILQCCQGKETHKVCPNYDEDESDIEVDGPNETKVAPRGVDMFTFSAAIRGYSALRHGKKGSWFIQTFCDKMVTLSNSAHFDEICTATIDEVVDKRWKKNNEEKCMVPVKKQTLRKKLYLPVKMPDNVHL